MKKLKLPYLDPKVFEFQYYFNWLTKFQLFLDIKRRGNAHIIQVLIIKASLKLFESIDNLWGGSTRRVSDLTIFEHEEWRKKILSHAK